MSSTNSYSTHALRDSFNVSTYLQRIGYTGVITPTAETLKALHRAHLTAVPYENLDIMAGRPFDLSEEALFDKIVLRQRGGFCYELNILFVKLLRELGFRVTLVSARIMHDDGLLGPEFDHPLLVVRCEEGSEDRWLADVGNARWFHEPLLLDAEGWQAQGECAYRLSASCSEFGEDFFQFFQRSNGAAVLQYVFTLHTRQGNDFQPMCLYKWTSSESKFTQGRVCSRILPSGERITLRETSIQTISCTEQTERFFDKANEFESLLYSMFGLQSQ